MGQSSGMERQEEGCGADIRYEEGRMNYMGQSTGMERQEEGYGADIRSEEASERMWAADSTMSLSKRV